MTSKSDYEKDQRTLWDALILIGSIALATLTILVVHLLSGGK
jgi:hypothetical protein